VPDAQAGAGGSFEAVSVALTGLTPGATYHYRVVATSHCEPLKPETECVTEGPDATFTTFARLPEQACPNVAVRIGPSAALSECRAYELVSPPDTNGRVPTGAVFGSFGGSPPVLLVAADGKSATFGTEGGALPGSEGGGFYDTYVSTRGPDAWRTQFSGLSGSQAQEPYPGGVSVDHDYSLWTVNKQRGSLAAGNHLRGPAGVIEEVGIGSLGKGEAGGRWISPGAEHLIFESSAKLEPEAPPAGTRAIYDRSPAGPTRVVSLLPGDVGAIGGQSADYLGATPDGSAVVFRLGGIVYVRLNNRETVKVVDDPVLYGGIADDASRVFYVKDGNVFAFETASEVTSAVGSGGKSTMVTVSADGSYVYFVSPLVLDAQANDQGVEALAGDPNLYAWDATSPETVRFIATVLEKDVVGELPPPNGGSEKIGGLGMWTSDAVFPEQGRLRGPANDPSRTSSDGRVLIFESRAQLSDYNNEGRSEIYRYEANADALDCVSCNPTGAPVASEARLESRYAPLLFSIPPVNAVSEIANLTSGGDVVFFQSADRLAAGDVDGKIDVYEWLAQGAWGCELEGGCIRLISAGHSSGDDFLYGHSSDGLSVFFLSSDKLVSEDRESTPSIYVARAGGGFAPAPAPAGECLGEACQPTGVVPDDPTPGSSTFVGPPNRSSTTNRRCPKGKIKAKRGKVRCVKRNTKKHRRRNRPAQPGRGVAR
jgi:hypothetical protein